MTKKTEQQQEAGGVVVQEPMDGITMAAMQREEVAGRVLAAIVGSPDMMNTVRKQATAENAKVAVMAAEMAVMFADALVDRLAK